MVYLLYSAHVTPCHCCIFTESCYFNILGNERVKNIIITGISVNLSHAQCRWLVNSSFTESRRRPNGQVTAATVHHVSRSATLAHEIKVIIISWHLQSHKFFKFVRKTNQTVDLCKSFNPAWSSKVFYSKLITNSMTLIESFITFFGNRAALSFVFWKQTENNTLHTMPNVIVDSPDNVTISGSLI